MAKRKIQFMQGAYKIKMPQQNRVAAGLRQVAALKTKPLDFSRGLQCGKQDLNSEKFNKLRTISLNIV